MHVEYVDGNCLIDGSVASLGRVETLQAEMTHHVLSRQPILTAIAVAAVTVACAGYVRRLFTLVVARRGSAQTFSERLRVRMERHRAHPIRYGLMLGGIVGLLVAAGIAYVGMDADKRASERALASLQFCHLALRSADEQHALAEQRDHLAAIQASERDIRALVDRLPPAEQAKAREIATQLSGSLGRERDMVAQFAEHADATAREVAQHQAEVARGLSKLDGEVVDLAALPASVAKVADDVHAIGRRTDTFGVALGTCNARLDAVDKSLAALGRQLDTLANKPPPSCPACTCNASAAPSIGLASPDRAAPPKGGAELRSNSAPHPDAGS